MSVIDDYLAPLPADQRAALEHLRATIRAAAPDATEAISYGMPTLKQDGHGLVAFAAFKAHCSLFPMSSSVIAQLADELSGFTTAKGTIRFTPQEPLPDALVTRIVGMRLADLAARG